jgi:hypothetical protein
VREAFDLAPQMWETFNMARNVQEALVELAGGENALHREGIHHKLEEMRRELGGPNPPPLERLLVERILTCWLQMNYEDYVDTQNWQKSQSLALNAHYQQIGGSPTPPGTIRGDFCRSPAVRGG